jgi:hypothetical protein
MRSTVKQSRTLNQRLSDHVARLRKQASETPAGDARERLTRLAKEAETASQIEALLSSPGLRAPQ